MNLHARYSVYAVCYVSYILYNTKIVHRSRTYYHTRQKIVTHNTPYHKNVRRTRQISRAPEKCHKNTTHAKIAHTTKITKILHIYRVEVSRANTTHYKNITRVKVTRATKMTKILSTYRVYIYIYHAHAHHRHKHVYYLCNE